MFFAVSNGQISIVKLLFEAGVSSDVVNLKGETPLFFAVRNMDLAMAGLLIDTGINPKAIAKDGSTALKICKHKLNACQDGLDAFQQTTSWRSKHQ